MTKQFTKDDMRDEYGVLLRNGKWYQWSYLVCLTRGFQDDLKNSKGKNADIMLVVDTDGSVLFKREEPETVLINGIEVPMPATKPLEYGQKYYYVNGLCDNGFDCSKWEDDIFDNNLLNNRVIHLTEEAVKQHVKALRAPFERENK